MSEKKSLQNSLVNSGNESTLQTYSVSQIPVIEIVVTLFILVTNSVPCHVPSIVLRCSYPGDHTSVYRVMEM